jgi:hypothetical protein
MTLSLAAVLATNSMATLVLTRSAAVAVMIITGWTLIRPYHRHTSLFQLAFFAGGAFGLDYYYSIPPFRILLLAACLGCFWPERKAQ